MFIRSRRSRVVAFVSGGLVVAGVGVALGGRAAGPASPVTRALPAVALALPAQASFVAGIDVKRLAGSTFYQKQVAARNLARPDAFRQLEEQTGVNPERDVDQVFVAGSKGTRGVAVVLGQFDDFKLSRAAEAKAGVTIEKVGNATLYAFAPQGKALAPGAFAFLDKGTLVSGDLAGVRAVVQAHAKGEAPLRANPALFALTERVRAGSTFWMVGDGTLLSNLSTGGVAGPAGALSLPNLKSLIVTGDLEPQVAIKVTGDATDEPAARSLAASVRGLASLFTLQAAAKPELKELATAFTVTQNASQVLVDFHVSPETLAALAPKPAAPKAQ